MSCQSYKYWAQAFLTACVSLMKGSRPLFVGHDPLLHNKYIYQQSLYFMIMWGKGLSRFDDLSVDVAQGQCLNQQWRMKELSVSFQMRHQSICHQICRRIHLSWSMMPLNKKELPSEFFLQFGLLFCQFLLPTTATEYGAQIIKLLIAVS